MAKDLLEHRKLGFPAAAGFFRNVNLEMVRNHDENKKPRFSRQAIDLYKWSENIVDGYGVTVADGTTWITKPAGSMFEMVSEEFERRVSPLPGTEILPLIIPVDVIAEERLTHVPTLLSQITSNRSLSSSTFKEIRDDFGNRVALDHVLFKRGLLHDYPAITEGAKDLFHMLLCLGHNELIVLVSRLLEEQGLIVPAPTGGFVRNVDLFVYNDYAHEVVAGTASSGVIPVPAREAFRHGAVTIQIRGVMQNTVPEVSPDVDYLIQLNGEPTGRVLNWRWIEAMLDLSPRTRDWLGRILRWVPFSGSVLR